MVWAWLGRAGVYLMNKFGRKKLLALAATFGAVIVARPEGGYGNWVDEKKDETNALIDTSKDILVAAGAGIGIVLLLVLFSYRKKGGD